MVEQKSMRQYGPYPAELAELVARLRYRSGWTFGLDDIERDPADTHGSDAGGLTFIVVTHGYNAYHPEKGDTYGVRHYFPVPAATYNQASWLRWLFDCLLKVETHECMEFFILESCSCGKQSGHESSDSACFPVVGRPYAPTHGPGDDPYVVHEYGTDEQRRTSFRGQMNDGQ